MWGTGLNAGPGSSDLTFTIVCDEGTAGDEEAEVSDVGPSTRDALGLEPSSHPQPCTASLQQYKYLINNRLWIRTPRQQAEEVSTNTRAHWGTLLSPWNHLSCLLLHQSAWSCSSPFSFTRLNYLLHVPTWITNFPASIFHHFATVEKSTAALKFPRSQKLHMGSLQPCLAADVFCLDLSILKTLN